MATAPDLAVTLADYRDPVDVADLLLLLEAYSCDPMGAGKPLAAGVRETLAARLADFPGAFSILVREGRDPVGLANCFTGFSTFAARPLVNIHDLAVLPGHRGKGIGRLLMRAVEDEARARGACKVTLEVLAGNAPAKSLYETCGFSAYSLDPETGTAQFWEKRLS
ncbi:GNAT family N-acetyltransferase [Novosphingobium sp. PC22D]|uniref:GNAT family N-acetyltransferase n=1 Tax=Novosphingobium sp. PC22D TaxID=1962403 RepID=UPI000BF11F2E|nr:GNAT family N-acetyltransferase [Novosphingobium sp. PC22D]PEQ12178.1 GNAT family N-acetyltransferase [Novosphingobium sp. PC22D]